MSAPTDILARLLEELAAAVRVAKWKLIVANDAAVVYQNEVGADGWTLTTMSTIVLDPGGSPYEVASYNYVGAGANNSGDIVRMPPELAEVAFKLAERQRAS